MIRLLGGIAIASAIAMLIGAGTVGCGPSGGVEEDIVTEPVTENEAEEVAAAAEVGPAPAELEFEEMPKAAEKPKANEHPTQTEVDEAVKVGWYRALLDTDRGKVQLELHGKAAPLHVANFVKLANNRFYDEITFHRVEPGFVVQTGDPTGTGKGGPGYKIKAEKSPLKHDAGALGMARTPDPDSAGSQWYITLSPAHFLDQGVQGPGYVVFGKVIQGMDVVHKIRKGDKLVSVVISKPKEEEKAEE